MNFLWVLVSFYFEMAVYASRDDACPIYRFCLPCVLGEFYFRDLFLLISLRSLTYCLIVSLLLSFLFLYIERLGGLFAVVLGIPVKLYID